MDQKNQEQGANPQTESASTKDPLKNDKLDQPKIIEEKITTVNGTQSVKQYLQGKMLGKGGFAKCYEFENLESKRRYAAKLILKSSLTKSRAKQKLLSEIKIHQSLRHQHIVKFEHVFEDSESVYILLEICSNQTLNELLKRRKRLHELEVQVYTIQIISALKHLHQNNIIHRDLKLANLFLNEKMEIKIGDFGLAAKLDYKEEKRKTVCGTPNYIAPEILESKNGHSFEVDYWSLGVIVYILIIGKPPFETNDVKATYRRIKNNDYSFPEHIAISDSARSFITKILVQDPTQRLTLDDMLDHPFLNYGVTLPKTLPISTLACPPSTSFISQFFPLQNHSMKMLEKNKLTSTTNLTSTSTTKIGSNTERIGLPTKTESENLKQNEFGNTNFNTKYTSSKDPKGETLKFGMTGIPGMETGTQNAGFNLTGTVTNFNINNKSQRNEIYVKKWVDYSTKYGLGYLLSNGCCGVFFNDSTKIIADPTATHFEYIERKPQSKVEELKKWTFKDFPQELQKKVVLLQHFRNHLEGDQANQPSHPELDEDSKTQGMVYVKKYLKTKHAIMFRLNNKIVQVNFTDKTEILLSSEQRLVTYVNKKGERSQHPLATALESSNLEMAKRLKYTKEILTHMLNPNTKQDKKEDQAPKDGMIDVGEGNVPI